MKKKTGMVLLLLAVALCLSALSGCAQEASSGRTSRRERTEDAEDEDAKETKEARDDKDDEDAKDDEDEAEDKEDRDAKDKGDQDAAVPAQDPDFRKVTWGMTMNEVKRAETLSLLHEDDDSLMYEERVAGLDAILGYLFDDDGKLYQAGYIFQEEHSNDNLYIDDYNKLVDALTEKYGEPRFNRDVWSDTLYQDDPEDYGFAVAVGDLTYGAGWETPTTQISLVLHGDNYECTLGISYSSKTYQPVTDSATAGL